MTFSEIILLPKEALDYLEDSISSTIEAETGTIDYLYGIDAKRESPTKLWIFSEEGGNIELLASLIHETLNKFNVLGCISISWADYCSKLRPEEFGGGAVVITKDEIKWLSTVKWVTETEKQMNNLPNI